MITPAITMKMPFRITASRPTASARVTNPACFGLSVRCGRRKIARATRSSPSSSRRATWRSWRPRSSIRPAPWAVTAARTSGASAIRSTSFWASSLASSWAQRLSNCSLSSARASARSTAGCPERPRQGLLELRPLQDSHQRPLHGGALGGADQRLLDRRLGGAIEAGQAGDLACAPRARFRSGAPGGVSEVGSRSRARTEP